MLRPLLGNTKKWERISELYEFWHLHPCRCLNAPHFLVLSLIPDPKGWLTCNCLVQG